MNLQGTRPIEHLTKRFLCKRLPPALVVGFCLLGVALSAGVDTACLPEGDEIVSLGKAIFFDSDLSVPRGQSCASCHDPAAGFADPKHQYVSAGAVPGRVGNRNAQSVSYAMFSPQMYFDPTTTPAIPEGKYHGGLFWDGRADTLEEQAQQPFLNPLEMNNSSPKTVVCAVRRARYARLFRKVFGPASLVSEERAYECIAQALAAYMRSSEVSPFTSKYDYWKKGQVELTEAEQRGYQLFTGTMRGRCFNCHSEPYFTNFAHQNLGTPRNPELPYYFLPLSLNPDGVDYIDRGLGDFLRSQGVPEARAAKEDGKIKIPSLRNCAVTAPYTHNGYHQTLREVVVFNNTRDLPEAGWPQAEVPATVHRHPMAMPGTLGRLGLNDQEIDDIVAFLNTLTDGYLSPAPPGALVASAQSARRVLLTWSDNATDETGFVIERSVNTGAFAILAVRAPLPGTGPASLVDTAVRVGNTYAYRVKAVKDDASSAYSDIAEVSLKSPAAPSNLTATAARAGADDQVTLSWTDNADNEATFTVQRSLSAAFTVQAVTVNNIAANSTAHVQTGVPRFRTFYYRIRAVNSVGVSAWSNVVGVTTP